jgi:Calcineurin-like phosphoesterase
VGGFRRPLAGLVLALSAMTTPGVAADWPAPWVELAADGTLSVRAAVAPGAACPAVTADDVAIAVVKRGAPDNNFPVEICEARAPVRTAQLTVSGGAAPILAAEVKRIVVFGDTGCRLEGRAIQDCSNPTAWPFGAIAASAAAKRPDLVIHLGDYYYRVSSCPAGRAGCAGSPHGDNWPSWKADFFDPAAPLLAAAPWVMVRGNHELCRRGGRGWFRLLDPYPARTDCVDRTNPYWLSLGGLALLIFDSADADDFLVPPDKVAAYAAQLAPLLATAPPHAWLLTHRPVWGLSSGPFAGLTVNLTEQAALRGNIPANLDLVLSGHLHDFLAYEFGPERPAQLIVGDAGAALYEAVNPTGAEIDGMPVRRGLALERFGYFVMERNGEGWDGTLYGVDDAVLARCRLQGRSLDCR